MAEHQPASVPRSRVGGLVAATSVAASQSKGQPVDQTVSGASEATVLDVGHGNTTVVRAPGRMLVVDAAPGRTLPDELARTGTVHIDNLVLSHADSDHIGGAAALLSGPVTVGTLWFNSDGTKNSETFDDLRQQAYECHLAGVLSVRTQLDNTLGGALSLGDVEVSVVHPSLLSTATGPRSGSHRAGLLTANRMSAVLRISVAGHGQVLLAGDIDATGFDELLAQGVDISARVLIYPHHGGRCGADDDAFACRLLDAVQPEMVVFSLGRGGRFANPQPEVVAAIRRHMPGVRIACTQLSVHCARDGVSSARPHMAARPAAGALASTCCAGTVVVPLGTSSVVVPRVDEHRAFIAANIPGALCQTV